MKEVFKNLFDIENTTTLRQGKFLFIFDGLDDILIHINLFDECELEDWTASTFLITSRLGFLSQVGAAVPAAGRQSRRRRTCLRTLRRKAAQAAPAA